MSFQTHQLTVFWHLCPLPHAQTFLSLSGLVMQPFLTKCVQSKPVLLYYQPIYSITATSVRKRKRSTHTKYITFLRERARKRLRDEQRKREKKSLVLKVYKMADMTC